MQLEEKIVDINDSIFTIWQCAQHGFRNTSEDSAAANGRYTRQLPSNLGIRILSQDTWRLGFCVELPRVSTVRYYARGYCTWNSLAPSRKMNAVDLHIIATELPNA